MNYGKYSELGINNDPYLDGSFREGFKTTNESDFSKNLAIVTHDLIRSYTIYKNEVSYANKQINIFEGNKMLLDNSSETVFACVKKITAECNKQEDIIINNNKEANNTRKIYYKSIIEDYNKKADDIKLKVMADQIKLARIERTKNSIEKEFRAETNIFTESIPTRASRSGDFLQKDTISFGNNNSYGKNLNYKNKPLVPKPFNNEEGVALSNNNKSERSSRLAAVDAKDLFSNNPPEMYFGQDEEEVNFLGTNSKEAMKYLKVEEKDYTRLDKIQGINERLNEIAVCHKTLTNALVMQGDTLANIEVNIDETTHNMSGANSFLEKAKASAKKYKKILIILFSILAIVLILKLIF